MHLFVVVETRRIEETSITIPIDQFLEKCKFGLNFQFSAEITGPPETPVPNSMSSSYDRDGSESEEEPPVEQNGQDLSNIKRILDQCHVLYKCKVDQHNRKVSRVEKLHALKLVKLEVPILQCLKNQHRPVGASFCFSRSEFCSHRF